MHGNVSDIHIPLFFCSFFQDGLKTADKLKQYIEKLAADLYNVNTSFPFLSPLMDLFRLSSHTKLIFSTHAFCLSELNQYSHHEVHLLVFS